MVVESGLVRVKTGVAPAGSVRPVGRLRVTTRTVPVVAAGSPASVTPNEFAMVRSVSGSGTRTLKVAVAGAALGFPARSTPSTEKVYSPAASPETTAKPR